MLKIEKGSALVFALIILGFLLVAAISVATVSVTDKKSSLSTEKSSVSFQTADSGVEAILQKIYSGTYDNDNLTLTDLAVGLGTTCKAASDTITGNVSASSGTYEITFYDASGAKIGCGDPDWRKNVDKIKSVGTYGNSRRAVEVAIAAVPKCGCWKPSVSCTPNTNLSQNPSIGSTEGTSCAGCMEGTEFSGVCSAVTFGIDLAGHGAEGYSGSEFSSCNMVAC